MTRIVLHIDKLVLRGIDRADAKAVTAGVQAELQRLLREPGTAASLAAGGDRYRVRATPAPIALGASAASTGKRIAASIASGVKP